MERGLTFGSSERQLSILRQLISVIASFPAQVGTPEQRAKDELTERTKSHIDAWDECSPMLTADVMRRLPSPLNVFNALALNVR